jgi:hypothetical protein
MRYGLLSYVKKRGHIHGMGFCPCAAQQQEHVDLVHVLFVMQRLSEDLIGSIIRATVVLSMEKSLVRLNFVTPFRSWQ